MKKVHLENGMIIEGGEEVVNAYLATREQWRKRKKRRRAGRSEVPTSIRGVAKNGPFSSVGEMHSVFKPEYSGWSAKGCGTNNAASNRLSVTCGPTGSLLGPVANSPVAASPVANYGNGSTTGQVLTLPAWDFATEKPVQASQEVANSATPLYIGQAAGIYNGSGSTTGQVLTLPKYHF